MSVLPAWPLTITELARHLGVNRATVHRALATAHDLHTSDPTTHPAPPQPANPGERPARYHGPEFVTWWPTRARRPQGRPTTTGTAPEPVTPHPTARLDMNSDTPKPAPLPDLPCAECGRPRALELSQDTATVACATPSTHQPNPARPRRQGRGRLNRMHSERVITRNDKAATRVAIEELKMDTVDVLNHADRVLVRCGDEVYDLGIATAEPARQVVGGQEGTTRYLRESRRLTWTALAQLTYLTPDERWEPGRRPVLIDGDAPPVAVTIRREDNGHEVIPVLSAEAWTSPVRDVFAAWLDGQASRAMAPVRDQIAHALTANGLSIEEWIGTRTDGQRDRVMLGAHPGSVVVTAESRAAYQRALTVLEREDLLVEAEDDWLRATVRPDPLG